MLNTKSDFLDSRRVLVEAGTWEAFVYLYFVQVENIKCLFLDIIVKEVILDGINCSPNVLCEQL